MQFLLLVRVSTGGEIETVGAKRVSPMDILSMPVFYDYLNLSPKNRLSIQELVVGYNKKKGG